MKFYWSTTAHGESESHSGLFTLGESGTDWQEFHFYFRAHGDLAGLRLDPRGLAGQQVEFDWIRLERSNEEALRTVAGELVQRLEQGESNADDLAQLAQLLEALDGKGGQKRYQQILTESQVWLRALRESGVTIRISEPLEDGTWHVNLDQSGIDDLTILQGAPISRLALHSTNASDLTPLRGMPLSWLGLTNSKVTDLSPLEGLPLETLILRGTKVTNLSALRGMPLTSLWLLRCNELTDLTPLADCPTLREITLPPNARNIEFLRTMPKLERISFQEVAQGRRPDQTATEFWEEFDQQR